MIFEPSLKRAPNLIWVDSAFESFFALGHCSLEKERGQAAHRQEKSKMGECSREPRLECRWQDVLCVASMDHVSLATTQTAAQKTM